MRFTALAASVFAFTLTTATVTYAEQTPHKPASTAGQQAVQTTMTVENAWSRELPPNAPVGAVFLSLLNHSDEADRLLSAESSIAEVTELHAHVHQDDMMRMVKVDAIDIAAHAELTLQPGGNHIMLINLREPLVAGNELPLTLNFENAGTVDLMVPIKTSDAGTSAQQDNQDHSTQSHH